MPRTAFEPEVMIVNGPDKEELKKAFFEGDVISLTVTNGEVIKVEVYEMEWEPYQDGPDRETWSFHGCFAGEDDRAYKVSHYNNTSRNGLLQLEKDYG